jgi:hypothetical protein
VITGNSWFETAWRIWEAKKVDPWRARFQIADQGRVPATDPPVMAECYEGAWLIRCECGGAEYAWEEGLFWCFSCGNEAAGHRVRRSVFPPLRPEIEALLYRRTLKKRTWLKTETVDDLIRENEEHAAELLPVLPARIEGGD